jgi:hypothetical protein
MDVAEIQPGKCYITGNKERCAVVDVNRAIVVCQNWTNGDAKLSLRANIGVKAVAAAVAKLIAARPAGVTRCCFRIGRIRLAGVAPRFAAGQSMRFPRKGP